MILGQHKAAQLRPEAAIHPARQRRHDQLPIRGQPALPAIADAAGPQDQVLNDEICVALNREPGGTVAARIRSSTATRGVTGPRRPLGELGGFGSLAFSIPLGLSAGRPLSPFSRAISARWAATVCSRPATLPSNRTTSAFSSVGESASRSSGGAIPPENQRQACQGSENHTAATRFAAVTDVRRNLL